MLSHTRKSLSFQCLQGRCKNVLKAILDSNFNCPSQHNRTSKVFSNISANKYEAISKVVFETEHIYPKPRSILIVKMALPLHEVSVTFLASELSLLGVMKKLNGRRQVQHVALGECALSQDEDILSEKFKLEVVSNTEADLVIKLKVDEGGDYERPGPNSDAYKLLVATKFNHDSMTLVPSAECHLPLNDFTYLMDVSAPSTSVIVTGHTWCNISTVHFQIWTLFPSIDMDNTNDMMKRGLARMRDRLATLLQASDPQFDVSLITQHDPTFPIKLN
ncbi:uncharacterized protein F5891DRAFT_984008 [Suillus fuscotomentosus]|uniref:Uncharacterized protein n=1 Tax=Suillus fuscotomentosus TaxID=1912939 RepID=A0AAD4DXH9_9AGAM|nr:uncharacterized protein F5891DRAFT_984008 [Suillus fuscotomentosus]KAG1895700.1 hypothetical protein F5891DRAFT_984008 [Suillus fuscotomentosus]